MRANLLRAISIVSLLQLGVGCDCGDDDGGPADAGHDGGGMDGATPEAGAVDAGPTPDGGMPPLCPGAGETLCGTACVDVLTDPANCGMCAMACATGEVCSSGGCVGMCTMGLMDCMGACVDTSADPANCGGC